MEFLTASTLAKMSLELILGLCIKLFCDNGRIHWSDFVNDFLFWVPGLEPRSGSGLQREVQAAIPAVPEVADALPASIAAK